MNSIYALLASNVAIATLLAVLVFVLTKLWRNPQFAHALWLLVLVKLVTPPLIHVPMPNFIFAERATAVAAESNGSERLGPVTKTTATGKSMDPEPASVEAIFEPAKREDAARSATQAKQPAASTPSFWPLIISHGSTWLLIFSGMGTLVLTCVAVRRHRRLLRVFAAARAPEATLLDDAKQVSRQIGLAGCPPVRVTDALVCPLVSMVTWKPLVLLPSRLLAELSREQVRSVLAHELAHIRRHDLWVRCFELTVLALFWWYPVAWWASRRIRQAQEECCDAWVVWALPECRRSYGHALLRTVEYLTEGRMVAPVSGAEFGKPLFRRRIEMIMKKKLHRRMPWLGWAAILVLAVATLPLATVAVSDEPTQDSAQPKARVETGPKHKQDAGSEVHLISIYGGFEQTGEKIHGPKALVNVDRPGKHVTLVLTSHSGATWYVTASKDTHIRKVILGGNEEQAVEGVPKSTEITKAWRGQTSTPVSASYKPVGPGFRRLVKQVYALTKTELASFHGASRSKPDVPFLIDKVQDNSQLLVDYPQPTPLDKLPRDAREIAFFAHHYVADQRGHAVTSSFGQYTVAGPVVQSLKPLPKGVSRLAYDPVTKMHYGISGHGVVQIDMKTNVVKQLKLGLGVPKLSWPCEITYDTKRKRVILGSSGGGGYLYAYSTEKEQWSVISKRPGAFDAFVYSPADDFIYGVLFEYSEEGNIASLAKVNANGAIVSKIPLGPPIQPGSLNTGPGVCTTQVAVAGKYIAILASPGGLGRNNLDAASIYLVDPDKKQVWLTSKKRVGKRTVK